MFQDLFLYFSTVFWKWVGLTMAIDAALALLNRFTALEVPRKVFIWVTMIGIFIAGYQAWSDEYVERGNIQQKLNDAGKEIASLKGRLEGGAGVGDKINSLIEENKQLQQKVEILQRRLMPRQIVKKDEFVRALRAAGPVAVKLEEVNDRDALFLYGQLHELFIASGWTADERARVDGVSWLGVQVVVKDNNAVPSGAIELVKQLQANGIASGLVLQPNHVDFQKVAFIVRIGYRPPDNNE